MAVHMLVVSKLVIDVKMEVKLHLLRVIILEANLISLLKVFPEWLELIQVYFSSESALL
jgi:hypothetical protein